jgi:hypothetical protein
MKLTIELKQFIRSNGFAWPGGYPCALMMADSEVIDAQSAKENFKSILRAWREGKAKNWPDKQWQPVCVFIHWEGEPLICSHSGRFIESAYGGSDE